MGPRQFLLASGVALGSLVAAAFIRTPSQDVAVLERLAPQIERAQVIAPESRDAIMRVVDRARLSSGDARNDLRRSVTIERVTAAIRTRDGGTPEPTSIGQGGRK